MKNFLKNIYLGRIVDRTEDEFIDQANERFESARSEIRWFCGLNDTQSRIVCQAL